MLRFFYDQDTCAPVEVVDSNGKTLSLTFRIKGDPLAKERPRVHHNKKGGAPTCYSPSKKFEKEFSSTVKEMRGDSSHANNNQPFLHQGQALSSLSSSTSAAPRVTTLGTRSYKIYGKVPQTSQQNQILIIWSSFFRTL